VITCPGYTFVPETGLASL
jgi:hypothetical protein